MGTGQTNFRVLKSCGSGEITEKRSRFIAEVFSIENSRDAEEHIAEVTKRTWDARHHCYAYVYGSRGENSRCSDDGEPSGTAGKPILEVITGNRLTDILVVVTRYFGGILLGTGGLVRAYTQAAQAGIAACETGELILARTLTLRLGYDQINNVKRLLREKDMGLTNEEYGELAVFGLLVPDSGADDLIREIMECTNGRISIEIGDAGYRVL